MPHELTNELRVCRWDEGSAGDPCHEPVAPGWRPIEGGFDVRIMQGPDVGASMPGRLIWDDRLKRAVVLAGTRWAGGR